MCVRRWKALAHHLADREGLLAPVLTKKDAFAFERWTVTTKGKQFTTQHSAAAMALYERSDTLQRGERPSDYCRDS